jgi:phosphatidylglycerophosphate synthase
VEAVLAAGPNTLLSSCRPPVPAAFLPDAEAAPEAGTDHACGMGLLNRSLFDEAPLGEAGTDASPGGRADRLQAGGGLRKLCLQDIPSYVVNLRRPLPVACFAIHGEADRRDGWRILIDATQKGTLDWPARYLHPLPENALVRLLLPTPVTPNHVTVVSNLCAFAAIGLFWQGRFWFAVALALAVGVLDGVDGKLARVKLLYSKFGDRLDHVLDVIYEPLWYLAIGAFLSGGGLRPAATPVALSLGIVVLYFADRATTGLFKRYKKVELFDRAPIDRFLRSIGARRNTNVLILLAGLLAGSPLAALWAVFGLTAATAGFHALRALQLRNLEPDTPAKA